MKEGHLTKTWDLEASVSSLQKWQCWDSPSCPTGLLRGRAVTAHVKELQELPMYTGAITCPLHARLLEEGRGHQATAPGLLGLKPQAKVPSK